MPSLFEYALSQVVGHSLLDLRPPGEEIVGRVLCRGVTNNIQNNSCQNSLLLRSIASVYFEDGIWVNSVLKRRLKI